jgi:F0F1-type ATP synthase assembly protein I
MLNRPRRFGFLSIAPRRCRLLSVAPISRENLQLIGQLSTIGFSFVFAIVLGFGGGYLLDGWLGSKPWFTFIGFFVGLAAGILNVYRVMKLADKSRHR